MSLLQRIASGVLGALALLALLLSLQEFFPYIFGSPAWRYAVPLIVIAAVIVAIRWRTAHRIFDAFIRYALSFQLCLYGFAKIFRNQFNLPAHMSDMRGSDLSGFDLTWYYFGYSYTFAVLIAFVQVAGAILVIFPRTKVAGALILLPVMLNIVLINIFFNIAPLALVNSCFITACIVYILSPHLVLLWRAIYISQHHAGSSAFTVRLGLAILILSSTAYITYRVQPVRHGAPVGKWRVEKLLVAGGQPAAHIFDWKRVYVEEFNTLIFCANAQVFSAEESVFTTYSYDPVRGAFKILFEPGYSSPDSVAVDVRRLNADEVEWNFSFQNRPVMLRLQRIN